MEKYYNVINRTPYRLTLQHCDNIEDVGDSFMLDSQLPPRTYRRYTSSNRFVIYLQSEIKPLLLEWSTKIKEGKGSCKVITPELRTLLNEVPDRSILNQYTPYGFHIVGSTITNPDKQRNIRKGNNVKRHAKEKAERLTKAAAPYVRTSLDPIPNDYYVLRTAVDQYLSGAYDINICTTFSMGNVAHCAYIKKLCSWKDINKNLRSDNFKYYFPKKRHSQDIPIIKSIWDNLRVNNHE